MLLSKPGYIKIYGHRGARGVLPENTLESFKYLFENNIRAYETDILISKDNIPVITHDFKLDPSYTKDVNGNWIEDANIKIIDPSVALIKKFNESFNIPETDRYESISFENVKFFVTSERDEFSNKVKFWLGINKEIRLINLRSNV